MLATLLSIQAINEWRYADDSKAQGEEYVCDLDYVEDIYPKRVANHHASFYALLPEGYVLPEEHWCGGDNPWYYGSFDLRFLVESRCNAQPIKVRFTDRYPCIDEDFSDGLNMDSFNWYKEVNIVPSCSDYVFVILHDRPESLLSAYAILSKYQQDIVDCYRWMRNQD